MSNAIRDENHVTVALGVDSSDASATLPITVDSATGRLLVNSAAGAGTGDFKADGTVPMTADFNADGNNLDNVGVVFLKEQAAADADVAGSGQIWVKTATPNQLWFTSDDGTDTQLGVGGGVTSSANITDNALVRGDGGAKGVQEASTVTVSDAGMITNTITGGRGLEVLSSQGAGGGSDNLVLIETSNASWDRPLLRINDISTGGGAANIRIDSPNPDIEFNDTSEVAPAGVFEIASNGDYLQFTGRNAGDTAFEGMLYLERVADGGRVGINDSTPDAMLDIVYTGTEDLLYLSSSSVGNGDLLSVNNAGVLSVGDWQTADGATGKIQVNSNATSPSSIDLSNTIAVGTGTGGANATSKYLGQFGWVSRDGSFTAPKLVAYIGAEATETYAADTDTGSEMVFYTGTDNGTNPVEKLRIGQDGALTVNQAFTLPIADGTVNQVLQTDGAGAVSWGSAAGIANVVEDTTPQLGGDLASNGNSLRMADADGIYFGTGNDMLLYHDGSNNQFISSNGDLLYDNTDVTGHYIYTLGTDTTATSFRVRNNSNATLFEVLGDGNITVGADGTPSTLSLTEKASIALDPAGGADGDYSGITVTGTGGATIAFGDTVYLAVADSRWELTDASAVATAGTPLVGIAVTSSTDGNPITVLLQGIIRADAKFPTFTVGAQVFLSETAGLLTNTAPTTADAVVKACGFAVTANEVYWNPDSSHITVTG